VGSALRARTKVDVRQLPEPGRVGVRQYGVPTRIAIQRSGNPSELEELFAKRRIGSDRAEQCRGDRFAAGGANTAHGHAHVFGADDHAYTSW